MKNLFFVSMLVLCSACSKTSDSEYRVGMLSFLTGSYANIGEDIVFGAKLAVSEFQRNNTNLHVQIDIEDGKGNARDSILAVRKLLLRNPNALLIAGDYQVPAVAPILNSEGIPAVATIVGNDKFLEVNSRHFVFRDWLPIKTIARAMADYAVSVKGFKDLAILYVQSEWGNDAKNAFVEAVCREGGTIIEMQSYDVNSKDVRSQIERIMNKSPDAVYVSGYGPSYIVAINQIRSRSEIPILTETSINNSNVKTHILKFGELYFADTPFNSEDNLRAREFKNTYEQLYGRRATIYSGFGFDSMAILLNAIKRSNGNRESTRANLLEVRSFLSLNGETTFFPDGDSIVT